MSDKSTMRAVLLLTVMEVAQVSCFAPLHGHWTTLPERVNAISQATHALSVSRAGGFRLQYPKAELQGAEKRPRVQEAARIASAIWSSVSAIVRAFVVHAAVLVSLFAISPAMVLAGTASESKSDTKTPSETRSSLFKMAKKFHKKNPNVGRMVTVLSGAGLAVSISRSHRSVQRARSQKSNLGKPLWSLFEDADKNNDGTLSYEELKMHIGHMIDEKKLRKILDDCDTDKNGVLDLKEFTDGFHKTRLR
jgi:Ca2+-binding EF-hand superfamily protein